MPVYETGEFVFADGRNWSYVVDSITDKSEIKTVDRTAISSDVVQNMRIPFSMEMLEMEARYHSNEPAVASVFRDGEVIDRLDWCVSGPGAGGQTDTFHDLILDEGLKKTNTLTDLVKQSVPLHINGDRETDNVFLGYYEFRNLGTGTYRTFNGTIDTDKIQNFRSGAANEAADNGSVSASDALDIGWHFPSLSIATTESAVSAWDVIATGAPSAGDIRLDQSEKQILVNVDDADGDDEGTLLDTVVDGVMVKLTDDSGNSATVRVNATPAGPVSGVETFSYADVDGRGQVSKLDATGQYDFSVLTFNAATAVNVQLVTSSTRNGTYTAIPAQTTPAVPAGVSPGTSGSIHDWRPWDTPRFVNVARLGSAGLSQFIGLQVVVTGTNATDVSFDVAVIMKRG